MSALRFLFLTLLLAVDSVLSPEEQRINITAEAGQDSVTLPCGARKGKKIRVVEWIRPDLDPDYVLLYRNGQIDSDHQHPSFRNRVDLQDRQMKDGDVSLILKNVTTNDAGTYLCKVLQGEGGQKKTFNISIHLVVSPPGTQEGGGKGRRGKEGGGKEGGGSLGLTVGLPVVSLLCVFGVAALICYRKRACLQRNSQHHPVDQREPDQL